MPGGGRESSAFAETTAERPMQNTIGQNMPMAGWPPQPSQLTGAGTSGPAAQGAGDAAPAEAMAAPCIGKPATKASTTRAAQRRRTSNLRMVSTILPLLPRPFNPVRMTLPLSGRRRCPGHGSPDRESAVRRATRVAPQVFPLTPYHGT